ncbi:MAG: alpha/beta hydrolase [Pseudomonadota bacterium]
MGAWHRALLAAAVLGASACGGSDDQLPPELACYGGGYRLDDGTVIGIVPRSVDDLRYVLMSGQTGILLPDENGIWSETDGDVSITMGACGEGSFVFEDASGERAGAKIPYVVQETVFDGVDGKRAGRLVLPAGGEADVLMVALHGSERWSGRTGERFQTMMPAFGIGVFAYDKRGTGASEGAYTQDFYLLADDAVRARAEAARLYGETIEIGYVGGSQGGWIGPLAASQDGAAFVVAAYGMAEGPLAEDREEVALGLREAGYDEEVIAKAREITDATGLVISSGFKDGYDELDAVREKYRDEPWYDDVEGEFSGQFLPIPNIGLRIVGPWLDVGTSWDYEPRPVIESLEVPQLWIIADADRSAPSAPTIAIIQDIQQTKTDIDMVVFPNTDHGIVEFTEGEDGSRVYGDTAEGYYPLIRDFILTRETRLDVEGPLIYRGKPLEVVEEVDAEEGGLPGGDGTQP